MSWAEFLIRLHGFIRSSEREMLNMREMAWITYVAPHQDPKKMKKSKEAFWPIKKGGSDGLKQSAIDRLLEEQKKYLKKKKDG